MRVETEYVGESSQINKERTKLTNKNNIINVTDRPETPVVWKDRVVFSHVNCVSTVAAPVVGGNV